MSKSSRKIHWRPTGKKQPVQTYDRNRKEMSASVYAMLRCHNKTPRQVGREYGITDAEVWMLYEEEAATQERKIYERGLRAGRLMSWPIMGAVVTP